MTKPSVSCSCDAEARQRSARNNLVCSTVPEGLQLYAGYQRHCLNPFRHSHPKTFCEMAVSSHWWCLPSVCLVCQNQRSLRSGLVARSLRGALISSFFHALTQDFLSIAKLRSFYGTVVSGCSSSAASGLGLWSQSRQEVLVRSTAGLARVASGCQSLSRDVRSPTSIGDVQLVRGEDGSQGIL